MTNVLLSSTNGKGGDGDGAMPKAALHPTDSGIAAAQKGD
jgi:hypothetical protein